jgi:hypothetical protein
VLSSPPYVLAPATFRFRGLISLAERLPLGGEREVVLATFLAARLLWDSTGEDPLDGSLRKGRAHNARIWLPTLALSATFRPGFQALFDALAADDRPALGAAWDRVANAVSKLLDGPARNDLKSVSARLARETALTTPR